MSRVAKGAAEYRLIPTCDPLASLREAVVLGGA